VQSALSQLLSSSPSVCPVVVAERKCRVAACIVRCCGCGEDSECTVSGATSIAGVACTPDGGGRKEGAGSRLELSRVSKQGANRRFCGRERRRVLEEAASKAGYTDGRLRALLLLLRAQFAGRFTDWDAVTTGGGVLTKKSGLEGGVSIQKQRSLSATVCCWLGSVVRVSSRGREVSSDEGVGSERAPWTWIYAKLKVEAQNATSHNLTGSGSHTARYSSATFATQAVRKLH
jgi:hypothetical protein